MICAHVNTCLVVAIEGDGRRREEHDVRLLVVVRSAHMVADESHGGHGESIERRRGRECGNYMAGREV